MIVTHEVSGETEAVLDRHIEGLFGRDVWVTLLRAAGFAVDVVVTDEGPDVFVGALRG